MFSTISSFLPSGLQLGTSDRDSPSDKENNTVDSPTQFDTNHSHRDSNPDMAVDEHGIRKRKERTHESFIVVRPPPSKSNHPLNLQVQLVPPNPKEGGLRPSSSRRSFDSTTTADDETGVALSRTSTNRSDVSTYTGYTSVTSFSSVASSSTTSSSRRMIIPLYNLQAHNVLTNVVVDAGTDAKIARFQKRGLEVIGLATLEPVEVWSGASYDSVGKGAFTSGEGQQAHFLSPDHPHTAASSAVSLTSGSHHTGSTHDHSIPISPPTTPQTPTQASADRASGSGSGARKFLGRIFKKKNANNDAVGGSSSASSSPRNSVQTLPALQLSPTTSDATPKGGKRSSLLLAASQITSHLPSPSSSTFQHHSQPTPAHSQTPSNANDQAPSAPTVLGISPSVSSPVFPPRGKHPKSYVWVVRRWLKNADEGLLGRLNEKLNNGTGIVGPVEVRFEWTRAQPKKRGRGKGETGTGAESRRTSRALSSNTPSKSSLKQGVTSPTLSPEVPQQVHSPRSRERFERSVDSRRSSGSPNPPSSSQTHTSDEERGDKDRSPIGRSRTMASEYGQEDDGEESDPEDSETPWTCTLVLRTLSTSHSSPSQHPYPQPQSRRPTSSYSTSNQPLPQSPTPLQSPTHQVQETRIRVGAIVPAPHHPKVVSLLKIPFPLPDIEVDKALVRKRIVTPAGVA
ncbi:hypothetical protein K474DRAFT_1632129, partial [Panus rudis PR-1116 ss-1]